MVMDKQIESILSRRADPPQPRSNLEYRIIEMARIQYEADMQKSDTHYSLSGFWQGICDALYLPRPAFAFAALLVLGTAVGLSSLEDQVFVQDNSNQTIDSYLVMSGESDYGEYL